MSRARPKAPAKGKAPERSSALTLRPLRLPAQHHATLGNGLKVTVVPRGPLPMVSVRLVTRSGSATDPSGKQGLADLTARLLRHGAGGLSANELGDASHAKYKERQKKAVIRRLKLGVRELREPPRGPKRGR